MRDIISRLLLKGTRAVNLEALIALSGRGLVMPFYHAVSDEPKLHLEGLYPIASVTRFEEDLDFFQKNFPIVGVDYLKNQVEKKELYSNKACFLSFDDGLREIHDVVAPVLIRRGITATFFINSSFVDNKELFYRFKANLLLKRIQHKPLTLATENEIKRLFQIFGVEYQSPSYFMKLTHAQTGLLDQVAEIVDVDFQAYLKNEQPYLTKAQIQSLLDQGFTIGAHSDSHPFYPRLLLSEQMNETIQSLDFIEQNFNQPHRLFSFPFSDSAVKMEFFDAIRSSIDLTFGTENMKRDRMTTHFQRIPMEIEGVESAEQLIKSLLIKSVANQIRGKHYIRRT